jgi:hypothetical protein
MAKRPQLYLCIDRPVPLKHIFLAANTAMSENPENHPRHRGMEITGVDHPARIAIETQKKWNNGRVLRVTFLDGSKTQRSNASKLCEEWSDKANISFKFGGGSSADIRISFEADSGSWSAIGTDCLVREAFPLKEPTMNFGWLKDDTDPIEWRRVVVHEFGHAIGAIHEHQNPAGGIKWNKAAVYAYFSGPPNSWSKADIDSNIINKYSVSQINGTKFDIKSIMLYAFPKELIKSGTGGAGTPNNTDLSAGDKQFIARFYPKN